MRIRQPAAQVIANLSDLLIAPRETLRRGEIRILSASRLQIGLWGLLVAALGAPFLLVLRSELLFFLVLSFGAFGLFFAGLGWWHGRPEIVLRENGVFLEGGRYQVSCPWALFSVPGVPFLRPGLPGSVVLPVATVAVPMIELRCDGHLLGHTLLRKARDLIRLRRPDTVELSGFYQINLSELGSLLLRLGPELAQPVTPQAIHQAPVESKAVDVTRSGDWIIVKLTQLAFPKFCCRCTAPTEASKPWHLSPRGDWLLGLLHLHRFLTVVLPVCDGCSAAGRRRYRARLLLGASLGTGLGLALVASTGAAFLLIPAGAILGALGGDMASEQPPADVANYSLPKHLVRLRFRNRDFADLYLHHLESIQKA